MLLCHHAGSELHATFHGSVMDAAGQHLDRDGRYDLDPIAERVDRDRKVTAVADHTTVVRRLVAPPNVIVMCEHEVREPDGIQAEQAVASGGTRG